MLDRVSIISTTNVTAQKIETTSSAFLLDKKATAFANFYAVKIVSNSVHGVLRIPLDKCMVYSIMGWENDLQYFIVLYSREISLKKCNLSVLRPTLSSSPNCSDINIQDQVMTA